MTDLLFVYGTLRRGYSGHSALKKLGARYVGKGSIEGELFDLGHFPGAREAEKPTARVAGEIYRLPNPARAFGVLDEIEGFRARAPDASLFRRATVTVNLEKGDWVSAWVYWLNRLPRTMRRIRSGDYREAP